MAELLLYTRQGCCLCEGLAEKLLALQPPPRLRLIDVDSDPALQGRFGLEVPLLAEADGQGSLRLLPRVPPRLSGPGLASWLRRQGGAPPAPAPSPSPLSPL
ncbi:MAG: glutaredoxin family protein [Cyanobium sp.]